MSDKTENRIVATLDSATVPKMQSINDLAIAKNSATVPAMQLAPSKQATPPAKTTQNSGDNKTNG